LALACITFSAPALALAQQGGAREFQDGARGTVTLPQREKFFADSGRLHPQTGTINETARDPQTILGPPDFSGDVNDGSFLSLGCDGSVIVRFTDNALIDGTGPDLQVFEVGPNVEVINLRSRKMERAGLILATSAAGAPRSSWQGWRLPIQAFASSA
jgi:OOP family OmpA-OmpF porin